MATAISRIPIPGKTDEPAGSGDRRMDPEQSPLAARQALIVLGPHRSGTSALTRVLGLSGAALPANILPAEDGLHNDGNTRAGFWESRILHKLHEEALESAGSKWDDLCAVQLVRLGVRQSLHVSI